MTCGRPALQSYRPPKRLPSPRSRPRQTDRLRFLGRALMRNGSRKSLAYGIALSTVLFGAAYIAYVSSRLESVELSLFATALLTFKVGTEVFASFFGLASLLTAAAYLCLRAERKTPLPANSDSFPPLCIVYLCCNDLDVPALESLARLEYRGKLYLLVHDDAPSPSPSAMLLQSLDRLRRTSHAEVILLRRPEKNGGKAGAVNYVLEQTGHLYTYFLLCDNDSAAVDPLAIEKAIARFHDDKVAVVQCRSVAIDSAAYSSVNRLLSRSIDVFHLFLSVSARFGWPLFIGHNAVLRTSAVRSVGGFTPGFFADDLDLTLRLNLNGYSVVYAADVNFGEKHPASYFAFRRRSYKWSYGCMQMLKRHTWTVLTTRRLGFAEKLSFFYFAGFYVTQSVLLAYLVVAFVVAPFFLQSYQFSKTASLIGGTVIVGSIYLPILAYFGKAREARRRLGSVAMCGLVYGTTDFACLRGIADCLLGRKRQWVPTNARLRGENSFPLLLEAIFGLALFTAPLLSFPAVLYLPCAYVFAGKFLFGPAIAIAYRDREMDLIPEKEQHARAPVLVPAYQPDYPGSGSGSD